MGAAVERRPSSGGRNLAVSPEPSSGPKAQQHRDNGTTTARSSHDHGHARVTGLDISGRTSTDDGGGSPREQLPADPDTNSEDPRLGSPGPSLKERLHRDKVNGGHRASGAPRICGKCNGSLTGQFVRALGDTYHLDCFTCNDCGKIVASKFFPIPDQPPHQVPLCETDYFRRLDLLCFACGSALRGSYITALNRKYHIEHFTCSVCPTVFGAKDSYYEHEGNVYCHYHYSTKFAQRCNGCQTAILKQFVEIFRNGHNQHWHPECYMINKYWTVRLHSTGQAIPQPTAQEDDATQEVRKLVRSQEEKVEEKVLWIWRTLSSYEEKSATCISDMLLHVSYGAYVDGVMAAKKFIFHVELLFVAADDLDQLFLARIGKGLSYSREAKLLCKKVVAFFALLAESQGTGVRRLGVTQELLSLVTGLAHYLKLLIRICLQGSLKLERETNDETGLHRFLDEVNRLDSKLEAEAAAEQRDLAGYILKSSDTCPVCDKPVEDRCNKILERVLHVDCMACQSCNRDLNYKLEDAMWSENDQKVLCVDCARKFSDAQSGFQRITRLQQYVHLLKVAHARLLATLRTSGALPHTSDDPNLMIYDSKSGHRVSPNRLESSPPLLRSTTRSKSYAGASSTAEQQESSYEQTLGDVRRLKSTRMSQRLSMTNKRASRVIEGSKPALKPSESAGVQLSPSRNQAFHIVHDRDANGDSVSQVAFGTQDSITLDDIPRIVAAEQAREQRPNAYRHARGHLFTSEPKPKLFGGHQRDLSSALDPEKYGGEVHRPKKYFSELTALEYFIVRHVAVLSMESLLEGYFNQEELLDLIETRKPTFWGKFSKAFKNDGKKSGKKKGVFGVSLEQIVEKDGAESTDGVGPGRLRVPAVVQDAVSAMRAMDMSVEGVFRKNGNIRRLKELADEIDAKGSDAVDLFKENPVQIAALLKKFLRELPDPVLTFKLHKLFITSQRIADEESRRRVLHLTCCLLPKTHRDTMEVLFSFLNWVSSFSQVDEESGSKMDIHNLATVITPNILYSNSETVGVNDSFLAIEAVHSLIECNEAMCEVPEDIQSILNDPTLFSGNADITTKEILKRYGSGKPPQPTTTAGDASATRAREGRPSAPVVKRVDTDPHQANAWQNESSVRHIQGPGLQNGTHQYTPPQEQYDFAVPSMAYGHARPAENGGGSPVRHTYRSSIGRQQGQLGVTGA